MVSLKLLMGLVVLPFCSVLALATTETTPSTKAAVTYTLAKGITDEKIAKEDAEIFLWRVENDDRGQRFYKLYRFMNKEALRLLVTHGNVKAMHALAHKIYWDSAARKATLNPRLPQWKQIYDEYNRNVYNQAIAVYELAIIHGSTTAIWEIMLLNNSSFVRKDYRELSDDDKKTTLAEILTWHEFARLRGNRYTSERLFNTFFKENNIELTADDVRQAQANAAKLYNDFSKRRAALGLGEFNNHEPLSIKKLTDKALLDNPYEQLRNKLI